VVIARIASAEYESGKKSEAHARLAAAIARQPQSIDLHTMSARLLLADRRFAEAESAARAANGIDADRFEPLYVLGTIALEQRRMDDALAFLRKAAAAAPRAPGPQIQLGRLELARGNATVALQYAREAVSLAPRQPLAQLLLVHALLAARDVKNAETASAQLLRDNPGSPEAQSAAGSVALLKGDLSEARRAFTRALALAPQSPEALSGLAQVELSAKQPAAAVALASRTVAQHPDDLGILLVAARTFLAAKDLRQAEATLQQALKAPGAGSSLQLYGMLAGIYFTEKRLDEAKSQFETLARQEPSSIAAPTMIGIILQLQNKPAEAQAVYERLLQTNAKAPIAANNLAMLLADSGQQLDVALNHAQAAKNALPQDPAINDTLGWVYFKKGLSDLAIASFKVSVTQEPANPVYHYHHGLANAQRGDKVSARQSLSEALRLKPDFDGADDARKTLRSVTS
jgi:tetratricopeptide (TPR) repeat protein